MMGSITEQHMATEVPVLIVGGGPTGLLAAYLLSKFGGGISEAQKPRHVTVLTLD